MTQGCYDGPVTLRCGLTFLMAGTLAAQSVRVVSPFQRIDPFGDVVAADRTPHPREILSPGVARNAFASFHIAVNMPAKQPFFVYAATNPAGVFQISLYQELYVKTAHGWIPDPLEPVKLPAFGILPYLPLPIEGQNTVCYWMDVWVPPDAEVQRVRLEVLAKIGNGWIMYPMEVRVLHAVAPSVSERRIALPPVTARADAAVERPFREFICHTRDTEREEKLSVRRMIQRNAFQEIALARVLEAQDRGLRDELLRGAGAQDRASWCKSSAPPPGLDTEWFLRVQDLLYRKASAAR